MPSKNQAEELRATKEAKDLVQSKPKEAPALLRAIIDQYWVDGKIGCALEARRWQCYALMANLDYFEARQHLETLTDEAIQSSQQRYVGFAEMYRGIIALECGESEEAVENFGRAIQVATELQDLDLLYRVQTNLAYAQIIQDRFEEALSTLKNCVRLIDVTDDSVSNATIYYNIAVTVLLLAFQESIEGIPIGDRLKEARSALDTAVEHGSSDPIISLITKVQLALYTGLVGEPIKGLEELDELELEISKSSASQRHTFLIARCQLLELAKKWPELCIETEAFLELLNSSRTLVHCQSILRQASRAYAKIGDFETAFYMLQRSLTRRAKAGKSNREDHARFVSMQQDLERQKFDQDVLRMRNKTLVERNKILEQEARYDPLSGLLNRRGTEEALQHYCERKFADNFMIVLLDIDHFKRINDNFGHAMGDQVIHEFATCLANSSTNPAKLGRWGGEEFLMVYDVSDIQEMEMIGQTLVTEIRNLNWDHIHKGLRVTASCGLSMWYRGDSIDNAIRIADDMMYEVKNHGRDNWRVWSHDKAA